MDSHIVHAVIRLNDPKSVSTVQRYKWYFGTPVSVTLTPTAEQATEPCHLLKEGSCDCPSCICEYCGQGVKYTDICIIEDEDDF